MPREGSIYYTFLFTIPHNVLYIYIFLVHASQSVQKRSPIILLCYFFRILWLAFFSLYFLSLAVMAALLGEFSPWQKCGLFNVLILSIDKCIIYSSSNFSNVQGSGFVLISSRCISIVMGFCSSFFEAYDKIVLTSEYFPIILCPLIIISSGLKWPF